MSSPDVNAAHRNGLPIDRLGGNVVPVPPKPNANRDENGKRRDSADSHVRDSDSRGQKRIEWIGASAVFAPLPAMHWVQSDLMLAPGAPTIFGAYSNTGKSLILQSAALAAASGGRAKIWNRFGVDRPLRVAHLDYEQGEYETRRRYHSLLSGMLLRPEDIGDRLRLSCHPPVFLSDKAAEEEYKRASDGVDILIVDSFRAAAKGADENDSRVSDYIYLLARVSEQTGAAIALVVHAGKTGDTQTDRRLAFRGNSAIFSAGGAGFYVQRSAKRKGLLEVHNAKTRTGPGMPTFALEFVQRPNIAEGTNPLSIEWREFTQSDADSSADFDLVRAKSIDLIRRDPGLSQATLCGRLGIRKEKALAGIRSLIDDGVVLEAAGRGTAKTYTLVSDEEH